MFLQFALSANTTYHILNYSSRLGIYKKAFALANLDWVVTMTKEATSLLPHFGRNLEAINLDENGSRLDETIGQARTLFALQRLLMTFSKITVCVPLRQYFILKFFDKIQLIVIEFSNLTNFTTNRISRPKKKRSSELENPPPQKVCKCSGKKRRQKKLFVRNSTQF